MLRAWRVLAVFLLLALAPAGVQSQPATAGDGAALEALETLRRSFAANDDFRADIIQEKKLSMMKRALVSRGEVRFKRPDLFFMELYPPHASKMVIRDNVMTLRLPGEGGAERIVLPPEQSPTRWLRYLEKPLKTLPEGLDLQAERRGKSWTLRIAPRGKGAVRRLTVNFDLQGNLSRLLIEERNGDTSTIQFRNLRRNTGLAECDFQVE